MRRYVWLDRLSVPQDDQPLKFTLLARMMAVYTAAKVTLAIRTLEESGSRYHERAWTCQEFGIARRLVVATQEPEPGDTRTALSPECDERMAVLRERIQTQSFVPLWLRANSGTTASGKVTEISRADAEFILNEYHSLSDHLNCQFPGDRLRALLPLVSRAPLEDHQELVNLVLAISRATGEDLLDWKESLLKQHRKEKRITQKGETRNEEAVCASWWTGDSPTADEDTAGMDGSSHLSIGDDAWHKWKPESKFRARVMGVVSQESVLEECNELQGMQTSVSGMQIVPHKKRRRAVKRDSTVSNFSEASSNATQNSGPSFSGPSSVSSTRIGVESFLSSESRASMSDVVSASLLKQPTAQGGGRRLPGKQRSLLSSVSFSRSSYPKSPDRNSSLRRPPGKHATISCIVGTDPEASSAPPERRDSLSSMIASTLPMSSAHHDESAQERVPFIDPASALDAAPEMPGPLPGPDGASGAGVKDIMSDTLSHTSQVIDDIDFNLPASVPNVSALPEAVQPGSCVIDMPGSTGAEPVSIVTPTLRSSQLSRCASSGPRLKSSKESLRQQRQASSMLALPISGGLEPDDGQQQNNGSSHPFAPDDILLSMEIGAVKSDFNGVSAVMETARLGNKELRRISEAEADDAFFSSRPLQRFLADAAKHTGKLFEPSISPNDSGYDNGME